MNFVQFTCLRGSEKIDELTLQAPTKSSVVLIGRDTKRCQWAIHHPSASRIQACLQFRRKEGSVYIQDNDSSQGSFLNKKRMKALTPCKLTEGDIVMFARSGRQWKLTKIRLTSSGGATEGAGASNAEKNVSSVMDEAGIKAFEYVLGLHSTKALQRPDGYVILKDLMANPALQNYRYTPSQIVNTARSDAQQRLEVSQEGGQLLLRSKQQHKPKPDENLSVQPLVAASQVASVVHATYFNCWNRIRDEGISRMEKAYIHCVPYTPTLKGTVNGLAKRPHIFVHIDLARALDAGIRFYMCTNDRKLILSDGNDDGFIEPQFFKKAVHADTGSVLFSNKEADTLFQSWKARQTQQRKAASEAESLAQRKRELAERSLSQMGGLIGSEEPEAAAPSPEAPRENIYLSYRGGASDDDDDEEEPSESTTRKKKLRLTRKKIREGSSRKKRIRL